MFFVQCGDSLDQQRFTFLPGDEVVVEARGDDTAVCNMVIAAHDRDHGGWTGEPIAHGPSLASQTVWLFCVGEPAGGVGVVSARSTDGRHFATRELPIGPRNHAGDDIQVSIPDENRAWVTADSLVGEFHRQVWTRDGGATWNVEEGGP